LSRWPYPGDDARRAAAKALENADRLAEPDLMGLKAYEARLRGDPDVSEESYRVLLGEYPTDAQDWVNFGAVILRLQAWRRGRSIDEARSAFERALALEPDHWEALYFLSRVLLGEGKLEDSEAVALRQPSLDLYERVVFAYARDPEATRAALFEEMKAAGDWDVLRAAASLIAFGRHWSEAKAVAELMTVPPRPVGTRAVGHVLLAQIEMAQGRWREAQKELDRAEAIDGWALELRAHWASHPFFAVPLPEVRKLRQSILVWDTHDADYETTGFREFDVHLGLSPLIRGYLLGLLSVRLGDELEALQYADELRYADVPDDSGSLADDLAHGLRAHVAWHRGDAAGALAELDQAKQKGLWLTTRPRLFSPFLFQYYERYLRFAALHDLGRSGEALRWQESFEPIWGLQAVYRAPLYRLRGEIYESLGDREKALEQYARFVEIWKNCDPPLRPAVEEVEARIARLRDTDE
jgi:tetratricopeptide (TPR) repeat protein